jgi:CheY-like chemotaxis protein
MAKAILISDSDKTEEKEFEKIFKTTDYHLMFSESGDDALLQIKLFKPDLIIAGTELREKSNLKLCEAVKTDPELQHIPFILLSNIFGEIPERDRERFKIDGIIYKPLHEDEVLNLVERLMEGEVMRVKEKEISEREMEWKSFADNIKAPPEKKEEFLLDDFGDTEEEIIELVEVVEEPEAKMSIDDFIGSEKEEPFGEITPLESWEKMEEAKPSEEGYKFFPEGNEMDKGPPPLQKEVTHPEDTSRKDLFEKIELKEILEKMDQLEPSPRLDSFEEFETALQKKVGAKPFGEEIQPFVFEEPEVEVPTKITPTKKPLKEELKALPEEEFPEELMEEIGEEEISVIEEPKEARPKEIKLEGFEPLKSEIFEKEVSPQMQVVERQMQEVISKGVREMMEDFTTKLVPEVTQNIINLTLDRIEKIVREIVPGLAEKAIQEEIKRLQRGDKE